MTVSVDGVVQSDHAIPLVDDRREHQVEVHSQSQVAGRLEEAHAEA